jgi:hypothetical protein
MKHTIHKAMVNYEKEEKWLNEMGAKGMNFIHYSWCTYLFEEGKPGEYIYRIELLKHHARHHESIAYIRFMEELGIECVSTYLSWVYFRKKAADGPFDLFSDYDSKIAHYNRVSTFSAVGFVVTAIAGVYNVILPFMLHGNAISSLNLIAGTIDLIIAAALAPTYFSYRGKMKKLKADRQLRE